MLDMRLDNMIDSVIAGTELVIEYSDENNEITYYNADNVPAALLEKPVSYMENLKQYDGTTILCFTVYGWGD